MIRKETLENFCSRVLNSAGLDQADAKIGARVLVETDMRGVYSHGTQLLPYIVKHVAGGGIDPKAKPEVLQEGPAWTIIDGQGAMGHTTAFRAVHLAMERARHSGVGMAGVRRGNHFGAAGVYTLMCAAQDMIGLAMCNTNVIMAVTGSCERSIGNNPLAFAAPAGAEPPIVLDIAASAAAGGKLAVLARDGKAAPEGWLINSKGVPSTDPYDFLERDGALLPSGGHKGYGLALLVEVLAAVLTGASFTSDVKQWTKDTDCIADAGYMFLAFDIKSIMPLSDYRLRIDTLIRRIKASRKAPGVERILIPGELEHENAARARIHGIPLAPRHVDILRALASEFGLQHDFTAVETEACTSPG